MTICCYDYFLNDKLGADYRGYIPYSGGCCNFIHHLNLEYNIIPGTIYDANCEFSLSHPNVRGDGNYNKFGVITSNALSTSVFATSSPRSLL